MSQETKSEEMADAPASLPQLEMPPGALAGYANRLVNQTVTVPKEATSELEERITARPTVVQDGDWPREVDGVAVVPYFVFSHQPLTVAEVPPEDWVVCMVRPDLPQMLLHVATALLMEGKEYQITFNQTRKTVELIFVLPRNYTSSMLRNELCFGCGRPASVFSCGVCKSPFCTPACLDRARRLGAHRDAVCEMLLTQVLMAELGGAQAQRAGVSLAPEQE